MICSNRWFATPSFTVQLFGIALEIGISEGDTKSNPARPPGRAFSFHHHLVHFGGSTIL